MQYEELLTRYAIEYNISCERQTANRILEREVISKTIKNDHDEILIEKYRKKHYELQEDLDKTKEDLHTTKEAKKVADVRITKYEDQTSKLNEQISQLTEQVRVVDELRATIAELEAFRTRALEEANMERHNDGTQTEIKEYLD